MATGPKLWSVNALATEFQKDRRTVAKRLEEVEEAAPGKYLLRHAAPAILGMTALDPTRQRAELEAARTRKLEIEISRLEGDSLDRAAVIETVANMNSRVRARLRSVASAQALNANPTDPARAEAAIQEGVDDALTELADGLFGSVSGVEATPGTNGVGVGGHIPGPEPGVRGDTGEMED